MPWHYWGPGPWGWWWIVPLVFFMVMVIMILVMMSRCRHGGWMTSARPEDEAFAILRRRFASGEIDADEYETRRRILAGEPRDPSGGSRIN